MAGKFSIGTIFKGIDQLTAPLSKMQAKLGAFGKTASSALKGANKIADKGMAGIAKFSDAIGIAGVASLAGVGFEIKNILTHGAELENTLIRAGSAFEVPVRKGTAGFKELTDAARAVGRTTEFSAQDAAEGINSLATAGFSAKQSLLALPKIIDFASAGVLKLETAADITSDTLGAFGLRSADAARNALNMGRVMDVMVRAAADSTTNVTELFEGIKVGGSLAATSGMQIEEYTGLLGVLANAGLKGSEAGTAIRNSILRLSNATPEATKTMKHLGIQVVRSKDGSIDMTATIGRFAKATQRLTKTQKSQALANIFGAYTVGPFLNLMNAGEDTIRRFILNLKNATGTTTEMAGTMREATTAKIAKFFNVIEDVRLGLFEAISDTVLQIADSVSVWVTANQELINTKAAEWIGKLRDNLPKIWTWTVRIAEAFAGFLAFAGTVKAITLAVEAYTLATKLAVPITWLWNAATKANIASNLALTGEVIALKAAQFASQIATAAVAAATWLYNAAITVGRVGTMEFSAAAIASKIAQWASQAATVAVTAATWLYNAALGAVKLATTEFTVATVAAKVAQLASQVATWLANAAQTAYAIVVGTSSGALGLFTGAAWASVTAIGAQAAALAPFLITIGAVTAAVLALYAAWDQLNKLSESLSGSGGILGTIGKMVEMGTFDPFKAHDAAMNEKARQKRVEQDNEARDRDKMQMVSPAARAAAEAAEASAKASVEGTITVAPAPGAKATVRNKPRTVPLKVQPSGAF